MATVKPSLKSKEFHVGIISMDTSRLDLNLLATLDALLAERNVTHAARRLNLSQPALSARLTRLREILGDPLLIPAQRGMVLTERARELREPLHAALEAVRQVVTTTAHFDPATAKATITIAASDYVQYAVLMPLICRLRRDAPGIRIAWRVINLPALIGQMERGEVDIALTTPESAPDILRQRALYREKYVSIARIGHAEIAGSIDLDLFCRLDHVLVSPEGGGFTGPTDIALGALGRMRLTCLSSPGFLMVPEIVSRSDMIALVPHRIVQGRGLPLQILPPPICVPGFDIVMAWHDRTTAHPIHRWVRERIVETASTGKN